MGIATFRGAEEILNAVAEYERQKEDALKKAAEINEDEVLNNFMVMQDRIQNDEKMRKAFLLLKKKFASDPEYADKCDPNFVQGVMLLDID